jgi:hypothetical protein
MITRSRIPSSEEPQIERASPISDIKTNPRTIRKQHYLLFASRRLTAVDEMTLEAEAHWCAILQEF